MEDDELEVFTKLADDKGEISKHDLIVHTKNSSFWKSNLDLKTKGCNHSTKVKLINWEENKNIDLNLNKLQGLILILLFWPSSFKVKSPF